MRKLLEARECFLRAADEEAEEPQWCNVCSGSGEVKDSENPLPIRNVACPRCGGTGLFTKL